MEKATPGKELNAVIVGSRSYNKCLVGNIILGRNAFDAVDAQFDCKREEGEVCGRRVTLVKAPGWLQGYHLCDTPELFKIEAILSVTLCPPGLHGFILVINVDLPFRDVYKKSTMTHLQHFFGEKVWDHTIVVFSHRGRLGHETIEDYIREEGTPLQSLLQACGNRYHVLCEDGTDNDVRVKQLFEKMDAMVAENSFYQIQSTLIQSVNEKRKDVYNKAEEFSLQTQQQRQQLRNLVTEPKPNLQILMVGWVLSGKSAIGNTILGAEVFKSGERTMKVSKQSGEVAGRQVTIVDTPGWWKFFPATFTPADLKSEILNGVSLCSPSPNVILLPVPTDTSFGNDQKIVIEDNMRLLGQRAWRHVIVLFTCGDTLGDKTIEQHIESEGKPLRWLIEICGKRYHVFDNMSKADDQVMELLEKMEEMVAGNNYFYLSETADPQPEEERSEELTENPDENTAKEITKQLIMGWDLKNWEKQHTFKGDDSMFRPINFGEGKERPEGSKEDDEETEHRHDDGQFKTSFGFKTGGEEGAGPGSLNLIKVLLEREWSRREVSVEHFYKLVFAGEKAISEPDSDQLLKSKEKVGQWLKNKHTSPSDYGTASYTSCEPEEETEHGEEEPPVKKKKK